MIAYIARGMVLLALIGMLFLMICGCLYLKNLFHKDKKDTETVNSALTTVTENSEDSEKEIENETGETYNGEISIVLDAGHGGYDGGTVSGEIYEKDIVFSVVQKMQKLLEQKGYTVILTRKEDKFISLEERVETANQSEADLFLSIHCNYFEKDSQVKGLECYYWKDDTDGKQYAEQLINAIKKRGLIECRNAKSENYYVIKNTKMPAILVELGYLSNRAECIQLSDEEYQNELAQELVESILQSIMV